MLLIGEPAEKKADPQNVVDGQFSAPFVVACALATGAMTWDSYSPAAGPDGAPAAAEDRQCASTRRSRPSSRPIWRARSRSTARGEQFSRTVLVPKGEPSNFLSEDELRGKFAGLTDAILGVDRSDRLAERDVGDRSDRRGFGPDPAAAPLMSARLAGEYNYPLFGQTRRIQRPFSIALRCASTRRSHEASGALPRGVRCARTGAKRRG